MQKPSVALLELNKESSRSILNNVKCTFIHVDITLKRHYQEIFVKREKPKDVF